MVKDFSKFKLPDRVIGLNELTEMVLELCDKGSTKHLEDLISRPDAVFLDEPYVELLKYIAALKPKNDQQKIFNMLMNKNFSISTLRFYLEEKLTVDEVVEIGNLAMNSLCRCSTNINEEFLNALDLCNLIFDCHFQKFVWHKDYCNFINQMISVLKNMIETCCQFTTIESVSKLRVEMPGLFAPPKSDYYIEKLTVESVQL